MDESLLGGNVGDWELILGEWEEPGTGGEGKKSSISKQIYMQADDIQSEREPMPCEYFYN